MSKSSVILSATVSLQDEHNAEAEIAFTENSFSIYFNNISVVLIFCPSSFYIRLVHGGNDTDDQLWTWKVANSLDSND